MTSGIYEDYSPAPVPFDVAEIPRYLDDELTRIAELKAKKQSQGLFSVTESVALVPIENPPGTWNKLFPGITEEIDIPDGSWNPATSTWTAPYTGRYSITLELQWFNIGTSGNGYIEFFAGISIDGANPPTATVQQDVSIGTTATVVALTRIPILSAGQTVEFYAEALSTQTTQTADVEAFARITKV